MDSFFFFIAGSIAVFRLTEMIVFDKGPFGIFEKVRNLFPQDSQLDELVECFYCMGIWMSLFVAVFYGAVHLIPWRIFPLFWLGMAGGSVIILRTIRPRK